MKFWELRTRFKMKTPMFLEYVCVRTLSYFCHIFSPACPDFESCTFDVSFVRWSNLVRLIGVISRRTIFREKMLCSVLLEENIKCVVRFLVLLFNFSQACSDALIFLLMVGSVNTKLLLVHIWSMLSLSLLKNFWTFCSIGISFFFWRVTYLMSHDAYFAYDVKL